MREYQFKNIYNDLLSDFEQAQKEELVQNLRNEKKNVELKIQAIKNRNIELVGKVLS